MVPDHTNASNTYEYYRMAIENIVKYAKSEVATALAYNVRDIIRNKQILNRLDESTVLK